MNGARQLLMEYADSRLNDPALVNFPDEIRRLPGKYRNNPNSGTRYYEILLQSGANR